MRALVPEYIEKLVPYKPGKPIAQVQKELGLSDVIKLASNENPFGPSPKAVEKLRESLGELHRYPDIGTPNFANTWLSDSVWKWKMLLWAAAPRVSWPT
jgi:histidinol-phosphate/aromatic aminotransferase/cobyric acid decarboxylase-like protein